MSWSLARRIVAVGSLLGGAACAVATPPFEAPTAADIPRLEEVSRRDPSDIDAAVSLAVGYANRGDLAEALASVRRSRDVMPTDPTLLAMEGILEQEALRPLDAARSYLAVLDLAGGPLAAAVDARLDAVSIPAARVRASEQLAASEASEGKVDSDRVVVIPFVSSPEDRDLADGLRWLIARNLDGAEVVDLALTRSLAEGLDPERNRWTELQLGLRIATLTGAGHVVSAQLGPSGTPGSYSWSVLVTTMLESGEIAVASVPAEGAAEELPRLAARVSSVLSQIIAGRRAVSLEENVRSRAPAQLPPLLEFARGWEHAWAGEWNEARAAFERAASLDGSFDEAADWARRAAAVVATEETSLLASLEAIARFGERWRAVVAARTDFGSSQRASLAEVGRRSRAEVAELLGVDRFGSAVLLEMTFGTSAAGVSPE